ncbi:MAG: hypothetical protein F6K19_35710, partial [Cyanothece sp. SIO1E1]|nr:hypothetical protein [Cyanothece sp. SIO1E1]
LADTAVVQSSTQDLLIEGSGNDAAQVSEQINRSRRVNARGRRGGSTGIVQDSFQGATVVGEDNAAFQRSSQVNVTEEVNRPRRRNRSRRPIRIKQ